eukprot:Nk52_evm74s352 gene=Nk52_evmTU74s352
MSKAKRKVHFQDSDSKRTKHEDQNYGTLGRDTRVTNVRERTSGKHTLDSDEEDDDEFEVGMFSETAKDHTSARYEVMGQYDVEGQEEMAAEDSEALMPFNLKEEMEEGRFDKEGNYYFGVGKDEGSNEDEEEGNDAWADAVDWKKDVFKANKPIEVSGEEKIAKRSREELLRVVVSLLKPGESVTKALSNAKSSKGKKQRLTFAEKKRIKSKAKKDASSSHAKTQQKEESLESGIENGEQHSPVELINQLTEAAAGLVEYEYYDIYSDSFETIVRKMRTAGMNLKGVVQESVVDEICGGHSLKSNIVVNVTQGKESVASDEVSKSSGAKDEVMWEYKWGSPDDDSGKFEMYGPYPNSTMMAWKEQGFFDSTKCCARRITHRDGPLYPIQRIDFDIYD